jgi:magnesium-transporting ATPase (P-type)
LKDTRFLDEIMMNPYDPPTSDIKVNEVIPDRRIGWKLFFLLMLILELFSFYTVYESYLNDNVLTSDLVGLFNYPFMLLGVFGYAFKKAFFHQYIWKIFFPISLLVDLWILFNTFKESPIISDTTMTLLIVVIIIAPIMILEYLVLYRYAFTNKVPWDK